MLQNDGEESARRHVERVLSRIRDAHIEGSMRRADRLTRLFLSSFHARYVATIDAYKDMPSSVRPPKALLKEIALSLNAFSGTDEKVVVKIVPKKDGANEDFRLLMDFGIKNRALQKLVLMVLEARSTLHPNQYSTKGTTAAVEAVLSSLSAGMTYAFQIDIKKCFSSFDEEKLPGLLPLPKEVTKHVIMSKHFNLIPGKSLSLFFGMDAWPDEPDWLIEPLAEIVKVARQGIPQGSSASPMVCEILLAWCLDQLPPIGKVVNYVDNYFCTASDANDAETLNSSLRSAIQAHPAGPLTPKKTDFYFNEDGSLPMMFLGYKITMTPHGINIEPTGENMEKCRIEFKKKCNWLKKPHANVKKLSKAKKAVKSYVKSWSASFSLWPQSKNFQEKHLQYIEQIVHGLKKP